MDVLMKQLFNQSQDTLYIIGSNHIGSLLPAASAREGNYTGYEGVFLIAGDGPDTLPEGRYLSYSYHGSTVHNAEGIPKLLSYAQEHGLTAGPWFLELLWVDIHQSHRTNTSQNFSFLSPERTSPFFGDVLLMLLFFT